MIKVKPAEPIKYKNPSKHSEFKQVFPHLFSPLQTDAYELIKKGETNLALVAPTSSGKTLAVSAPLFEEERPTVFVYPFRALVLDQTLQLLHIGNLFGLRKNDFGDIIGGTDFKEVIQNVEGKKFLVATPDKLISLLASARREKHGLMITILRKYHFVFDEIHTYNSLMLTSLKYFIRSVQEFRPNMKGFYFLSATFPVGIWHLLENELGMTEKDQIPGKSFSGEIELEIMPEKTSRQAGKQIAQIIKDLGMGNNCVAIFNAPLRAWQVSRELNAGLFVGQDKMSEKERVENLDLFNQNINRGISNNILCGSPAIEAGIDFKADNLIVEESYADSFIQRLGRAGRAGRPCKVLAFSDTLHMLAERGELREEYSRTEFLQLLTNHCKYREPTKIFNGLACYAYYKFWKRDERIFDEEDLEVCKELDDAGVDYSPFRGFIPYIEYETGKQKIGFKSLFKKDLPILPNGKVKGAPSPERYFYCEKRPPVFTSYLKTVLKDDFEEKEGQKRWVVLAQVRFEIPGLNKKKYWTVLDVDLTDRNAESPRGDDNIELHLSGYTIGGNGEGRVRFFEVDA